MGSAYRSSITSFFLAALLVCCCSLLSCDRYEYPIGKVKAPENSPEYTVEADINHSPAVTPAAVSVTN